MEGPRLLFVCASYSASVTVPCERFKICLVRLLLAFSSHEVHVLMHVEAHHHLIKWLRQATRLQVKVKQNLQPRVSRSTWPGMAL